MGWSDVECKPWVHVTVRLAGLGCHISQFGFFLPDESRTLRLASTAPGRCSSSVQQVPSSSAAAAAGASARAWRASMRSCAPAAQTARSAGSQPDRGTRVRYRGWLGGMTPLQGCTPPSTMHRCFPSTHGSTLAAATRSLRSARPPTPMPCLGPTGAGGALGGPAAAALTASLPGAAPPGKASVGSRGSVGTGEAPGACCCSCVMCGGGNACIAL